jgi:hypothetical protein
MKMTANAKKQTPLRNLAIDILTISARLACLPTTLHLLKHDNLTGVV